MIKFDLQAEMPFAPLLAMPLDKSVGSFGQSGSDSHNDFFEEYLTFDTVNADGSMYLNAPESTLLVSKAKGSNSAGISIEMWKDEARQDFTPRSRGGQLQHERPASPHDKFIGHSFHLQDSGGAAGPDFELISLEKISIQSPRLKTPPSSPELLVTKKTRARQRILEGFHKPFQTEKEKDIKTLRKSTSPIRKATCPAKMRRSQYGDENFHSWGQQLSSDVPKFNFDFEQIPLSPPPSGRVSETSENNMQMAAATRQHSNSYAWDHPISEQYAYRTTQDIESPHTTPPADIATFNQSNIQHATANDMIYTTSHQDQSSTPWIQTPMNSDYTFQTSTPYVEAPETPIWWATAATTPLTEPAPSTYRRQNQQNTQSLAMQLQAELVYNANELALGPSNIPSGLMIQMPSTPTGQSFVVGASPMDPQPGYFERTAASQAVQPQHGHQNAQSQLHIYAPLPARQEKSHSRSHSHSHRQSRTESFSPSPSPRGRTSSTHRSKKTRSSSHKRAGDGGQKTPKGSAVALSDFVNFTPKDSNKILTGVAPSGSSKTKARREKEAAEKTRRLSQAAVRAVQAVGGSIDTLVEEGLFDGPELEEMS